MNDIISWLISIEHLSGKLYEDSLAVFSGDENFRKLLEGLAEDEAMHFHVMGSAAEQIKSIPLNKSLIALDQNLKDKIERPIRESLEALARGTLSKEEFTESIIDAEYSEWNDIFTYIVNTLKVHVREFKYAAIKIQNHLRKIEHYLEGLPDGHDRLEDIKKLKPVWQEKIMIVDDEPAITDFLAAILDDIGEVSEKHDGKDALEQLQKGYFKIILSDIDMPVMNGMEFYEQAIEKYPNMKDRFLFFTGTLDEKREAFFSRYNVPYFIKPATIDQIRNSVFSLLGSAGKPEK